MGMSPHGQTQQTDQPPRCSLRSSSITFPINRRTPHPAGANAEGSAAGSGTDQLTRHDTATRLLVSQPANSTP